MEKSGGLASDLTRCWIAPLLVDARSVLECAAAAALSIPPAAPAAKDPEKHTAANAPPQRVLSGTTTGDATRCGWGLFDNRFLG